MSTFTRVRRRQGPPAGGPRIYADLDELIRLRHKSSGFSFLPRQPVHSVLSGRHASRLRGRGLNFEELREYLPGDDSRTIDWRVTARTGDPHVRVYTEERDRPVWLLVDQRSSMFFGSRGSMKSVTAAELAAVGAWRVLSQGDRVGAVLFNDSEETVIPPHRSADRVMRILGEVVRMNRQLAADSRPANPSGLNKALTRAASLAPHDALVCVVSDGFGMDAETRRAVTNITAHNDVLFAFVHDPLEANLPDAGQGVMTDGAHRLSVDTGSKSLRKGFAKTFAEREGRVQSVSRRHAVPVLSISTDGDVLDQVRRQLGQHEAPRRA